MELLLKRNEDLVITVLRFAGASVFLWFGLDKFIHPEAWYGWVPDWVWPYVPMSAEWFMLSQACLEFAIGLALILGRFVRTASALAAAFLAMLFFFFGSSELILRDNALIGIYLALFINANRTVERRQVPRRWLAGAVSLYLVLLLVSGVLYLRAA
jgi:uncharacterized membrane protein YphA (DoxX/SURF4 family)